jgi:hypothetical protein
MSVTLVAVARPGQVGRADETGLVAAELGEEHPRRWSVILPTMVTVRVCSAGRQIMSLVIRHAATRPINPASSHMRARCAAPNMTPASPPGRAARFGRAGRTGRVGRAGRSGRAGGHRGPSPSGSGLLVAS